VKLADRVSRKDKKPMLVKTQGKEAFTGKLIVLINSESDSASELLARVVQLEKRGTVIGDQSGGKVMESQGFTGKVGVDYVVLYGLSITSANLIMTDGKSLKNVGVTPDEVVLPSAQDLSDGKDPVLAHAMQLAGFTIDPTAAGKLFPFGWPDL
jgi:carboxyl-terminal processing protease